MINTSNSIRYWISAMVLTFFSLLPVKSESALYLVDKLQQAKVGDYIVTAIDNTFTALIIKEKDNNQMSIEEITIPRARLQHPALAWKGWRKWVESGAPGNTSWVMYTVHLPSGQMMEYYSFTKNAWCNLLTVNNFLSKLLTLRMDRLPSKDKKRIGPPPNPGVADKRRFWTPQMTYEGRPIYNVAFEAWRTRWPKDGTELSNKTITVYVPEDDSRYPSYFPYWLEIQGIVGKAKIRIIDSGRELFSLKKPPKRA